MTSVRWTATDAVTGAPVAVEVDRGRARVRPAHADARAGWYLAPGWFDLQVNGYGGLDVNADEPSADAVRRLTRLLWQRGVAAWLPTVITASVASMERALRAIVAARVDPAVRASIPGIHLEGPWISLQDGARGAHPRAHVAQPSVSVFDRLQVAADGAIRLVTLAPELSGAPRFIRDLRARGVTVALGHTLADTAAVGDATSAGASLSTHLGNGLPAFLPRHANPLWAQLGDDGLMASVIADGHHLPPAVLKTIVRVKGVDRTVLVSDSAALAGMPVGTYTTPVGGTVEVHGDGSLRVAGTEYLAGSGSCLAECTTVARRTLGCSERELALMAAQNPRRLLGIEHASHTLYRVDETGATEVVATVVGGELRYGEGGHPAA